MSSREAPGLLGTCGDPETAPQGATEGRGSTCCDPNGGRGGDGRGGAWMGQGPQVAARHPEQPSPYG